MQHLITFIFPILISLFVCTSCNDGLSEESLQAMNTTIELSIKQTKWQHEEIFYSSQTDKREPQYFRYLDLHKGIEVAFNEFNDLFDLKDNLLNGSFKKLSLDKKREVIFSLNEKLIKCNSNVYTSYDTTLSKNLKIFGLKKEEYEKRIKTAQKKINESQSNLSKILNESNESDEMLQLKLNHILLTASNHQTYFMESFRGLTSGCFRFQMGVIPVIVPKKGCLKKGEYFEADIYIGDYFSSFDPNTTLLLVDSDTLRLNKEGNFNYKLKTETAGDFKLNMEGLIQHPISKEYHKISSTYEYHVD